MDNINIILQNCISLKPKDLIMDDLKWKYLIRAIIKSKNIMIIGPTGCGKTMAARYATKALDRMFFSFNCGGSQDARATLIGNTTYKKDIGTLFFESEFVEAIKTKNSVILLDELTRGTHDLWNILFPVLDTTQRYLRLDEKEKSPVIKVADGVTFIATANIGSEYTSTRVIDKALSRRFPIKLEMLPLTGDQLKNLFGIIFPSRTKDQIDLMENLAEISDDLIAQSKLEDSKISSVISPANIVEMAELVMDGFSLAEIAEAAIYPEYPDKEEREFCHQILQKYFPSDVKNPNIDPRRRKK